MRGFFWRGGVMTIVLNVLYRYVAPFLMGVCMAATTVGCRSEWAHSGLVTTVSDLAINLGPTKLDLIQLGRQHPE